MSYTTRQTRMRRVGLFMAETAGTIRFSWDAAFRDYTPIWLNLCDDKTYQKLLETDARSAEMPTFPQEGSIRKMDGVLVDKGLQKNIIWMLDWKNKRSMMRLVNMTNR